MAPTTVAFQLAMPLNHSTRKTSVAPLQHRTFTQMRADTPHTYAPVPPLPLPISKEAAGPSASKPLDIVLTHASADFDSLGCAVGLAKLISPSALVVLPAGVHSAVRRYLTLHKSFFPIAEAKLIDPTRIRFLGVVDTCSKKKLATAASWLSHAETVLVIDHHVTSDAHVITKQDVPGDLHIITEDVGAATTLVVERLMQRRDIKLTATECTLLALAIHTDTGSLSFENTTPRDAAALAWLLQRGACQRSISQFARNYLTTPQQRLLANALDTMVVRHVDGMRVANVILEANDYVSGMAGVAQAALELANIDALLLAVVVPAGRKSDVSSSPSHMKRVSIICRALSRVDGIDFSALLRPHGGGGHPQAAALTTKVRGGEAVGALVESLMDRLMAQLPPPTLARDFMSTDVVAVTKDQTMGDARTILFESGHTGIAVVRSLEGKELLGVISRQDIAVAEKKQLLKTPVKGWVARKVITVAKDTPLHEIERLLVDNNIGRLPVVEDGQVIGIVTRSDVLVQRRLFDPNEDAHAVRNVSQSYFV
ncbi:Inosine-5'-monophosphate dehydrogenase [Gracilariopsis chorda]|uniref:Inosine-5'-monophosphate dehydrogenase n=1 Tax=Gracilariopsis chorda TaxID=448386 RepID=A0A2V3IZW7_9FLOR|nr:Inosine-5'-monophosphate dehydrogenase [Gracilariopsis chorda]|eukprot:PXF46650.1 Inosine-5'-monophosphate dehydrogenase [Gracilariopsis chorda]